MRKSKKNKKLRISKSEIKNRKTLLSQKKYGVYNSGT
nr:MAG TPA: hypothetical protein [Caudoviricetes sp.]